MIRLPKPFRNLRYRIFYGLLLSRRFELATLGDTSYGVQWTIAPKFLDAKSVIYSGGVGEDISFEHALVKRFGCKIYLYDPSPTGVKTMARSENQIPQLHYSQCGIAGRDGTLKMAPPQPGDISWSAQTDSSATLEVPCRRIQTLMQQNGHSHIDLLKLDIEGCEYEVIDEILKRRIPVRQLCADFDYGYVQGVRRSQAIGAMLKLAVHRYKLVSQDGANHTFISSAAI